MPAFVETPNFCKWTQTFLKNFYMQMQNNCNNFFSHLIFKLAWESQLTVILFKLILIIKLACESQLTEILFKLIKLACESQLTEILFKLIIIKLACESQLTEILFKLIIIIIIILLRLNFWLLLLLEL